MQYNKTKIIFFIVVAILLVGIAWLFMGLSNSNHNAKNTRKKTDTSAFRVWMVSENPINMSDLLQGFKKAVPSYKSQAMQIEVFSNYEEYNYALTSAFASGDGPDVFTLNNNEHSVLTDNSVGISPDTLKVSDFRKSFKPVFSNDLIEPATEKNPEFVKGIPVGYETLGLFYNKKYVRSNDLATFAQLNSKIREFREKNSTILPIAMGNGGAVKYAPDIITQMMLLDSKMQEAKPGITNLKGNLAEKAIANYLMYGQDENLKNNFDDYYTELVRNGKTGAYMLANNQAAVAVGYPKFLEEIEKELSSHNKRTFKSFLAVEPFPYFTPGIGKTLVNYDYFAMNKNAAHPEIAENFLIYLATEE